MIFARKIYKIPEFYMIFARKMPEFYIIIARKIFSRILGGGARVKNMYAYAYGRLCMYIWLMLHVAFSISFIWLCPWKPLGTVSMHPISKPWLRYCFSAVSDDNNTTPFT